MIHPLDLTGRRVLVTGASSGLGRAAAIRLSELGAQVLLTGRDDKRLEETRQRLTGEGHVVSPLDLSQGSDFQPWLRAQVEGQGPLDGMVHAAGTLAVRPLKVLTAEQLRAQFEVNVFAATLLIKAFRTRGMHAESASVVLLSSVMGLVGQPGIAAYASSKGALIALARALALELARDGIRVNCIAPGVVRSEMAQAVESTVGDEAFAAMAALHPLGLGRPEDVADAVAFLIAPTSRWITGTTLVVDGGYTAA